MIREERIKYLNQLIIPDLIDNSPESCELRINQGMALMETIEELKQEPCEDCISRSAVLDVIKKCHCEEWVKADIGAPIEALPSVTPQPKMGRWIKQTLSVKPFGEDTVLCDQCAFMTDKDSQYNYCPNCGCKMQEVEE